jgi:hypothetical protein
MARPRLGRVLEAKRSEQSRSQESRVEGGVLIWLVALAFRPASADLKVGATLGTRTLPGWATRKLGFGSLYGAT